MGKTETQTIPFRTFGKTGEKVPIFGLGTGPSGMGLTDDDAIRLYRRALELGTTYIDTAPGYDRAQSQLSRALKGARDGVFLTTKVPTSDGATFTKGIEENLKTLGVEYVDLAYIHSVGRQDIDILLSAGGSLEALLRVKERGLARYIGFTAHNKPSNAVRVLEACDKLDAVMLAMNFVDRHVYGFEDRVLPLARKQGLGVAAMKVYGGATDMEYHRPVKSAMEVRGGHDLDLAFRYTLSLPGVSLNVIGVYSQEELGQNIARARDFTPLSAGEAEALDAEGRQAAGEWGARYGEQ
ncbi:MAG: aldo/keto reductase [Spirochaetales bacterium]|nr:aldo/keto reductase [Spirochaetales bacterium]